MVEARRAKEATTVRGAETQHWTLRIAPTIARATVLKFICGGQGVVLALGPSWSGLEYSQLAPGFWTCILGQKLTMMFFFLLRGREQRRAPNFSWAGASPRGIWIEHSLHCLTNPHGCASAPLWRAMWIQYMKWSWNERTKTTHKHVTSCLIQSMLSDCTKFAGNTIFNFLGLDSENVFPTISFWKYQLSKSLFGSQNS